MDHNMVLEALNVLAESMVTQTEIALIGYTHNAFNATAVNIVDVATKVEVQDASLGAYIITFQNYGPIYALLGYQDSITSKVYGT